MNLEQLKQSLQNEFYVDNLFGLADICRKLALECNTPTPFFVMGQIFSNIAQNWDDKPLSVEFAAKIKSELMTPINHIIKIIELEGSEQQIFYWVNNLIVSYLTLNTKID